MIGNITNSPAAGASIAGALTGGSTLGKDEFLKLLVAQLQNQDPLNPNDPTEFTAQLAQFSALEQAITTNELLAQLATTTKTNHDLERLSAFSLLGKKIEVPGPDFHYNGAPIEFGYNLESQAESLAVKVLDQQQQVVAFHSLTETTPGRHYQTWDGTGLNGQPLPAGYYSLQIERQDGENTTIIPGLISSTVNGVDLTGNGNSLTTPAGSFDLTEVIGVTG